MSGKLEVNRLTREELEYELECRGVTERKSVGDMRAMLRQFIKLEAKGKVIVTSPGTHWDPATELDVCKNKMEELNKLLDAFYREKSQERKIDTGLTHLLNRVERIAPPDLEMGQVCSALLSGILKCWTDLESKVKGQTGEVDTSSSEAEEQDEVRDWGVTFSGDGQGPSLLSFLDVNHYRRARHVSKRDLFLQACDLFHGPAAIWYRSVRREVTSWEDLEDRLRQEFEDEDYEDRLMAEIMSRTQGPDVQFGTYVAIMKTYFSRLPSPLSEAKKLRILKRGVTPYFYKRICALDPISVDEFLERGRRVQRQKDHMSTYKPPPPVRKDTLEPDLAYRTRRRDSRPEHVAATQELPATRGIPNPPGKKPDPPLKGLSVPPRTPPRVDDAGNVRFTCWHCHQAGHRFHECAELHLTFCTRCGKQGVSGGRCDKCKGKRWSGNGEAGRR
ncbi:hypothetical protein AAG570_011827 [Ranatra chinensis]|uniref:Retrotransposon gag domain-containing protein n=1 Tax=Ranatra chinensis TaxID=642074 RepID=A0ABD0YHB4_9HEMI